MVLLCRIHNDVDYVDLDVQHLILSCTWIIMIGARTAQVLPYSEVKPQQVLFAPDTLLLILTAGAI